MVIHLDKHEISHLELSRPFLLVGSLIHLLEGYLQVSTSYTYLIIPILVKICKKVDLDPYNIW